MTPPLPSKSDWLSLLEQNQADLFASLLRDQRARDDADEMADVLRHRKPDRVSLWTEELKDNPFLTREQLTEWQSSFHVHPTEFEQQILDDLNRNADAWREQFLGNFMGVDLGAPDGPLGTLAIPGALPMTSTSAPSSRPEPTEDNLTFEAIQRTIADLFKRPMLRALWFVDCPHRVSEFTQRLTEIAHTSEPMTIDGKFIGSGLWTLPLLEWSSSTATDEETRAMLKAGRYFIHSPGVWLEMSDGLHRKVSLT